MMTMTSLSFTCVLLVSFGIGKFSLTEARCVYSTSNHTTRPFITNNDASNHLHNLSTGSNITNASDDNISHENSTGNDGDLTMQGTQHLLRRTLNHPESSPRTPTTSSVTPKTSDDTFEIDNYYRNETHRNTQNGPPDIAHQEYPDNQSSPGSTGNHQHKYQSDFAQNADAIDNAQNNVTNQTSLASSDDKNFSGNSENNPEDGSRKELVYYNRPSTSLSTDNFISNITTSGDYVRHGGAVPHTNTSVDSDFYNRDNEFQPMNDTNVKFDEKRNDQNTSTDPVGGGIDDIKNYHNLENVDENDDDDTDENNDAYRNVSFSAVREHGDYTNDERYHLEDDVFELDGTGKLPGRGSPNNTDWERELITMSPEPPADTSDIIMGTIIILSFVICLPIIIAGIYSLRVGSRHRPLNITTANFTTANLNVSITSINYDDNISLPSTEYGFPVSSPTITSTPTTPRRC